MCLTDFSLLCHPVSRPRHSSAVERELLLNLGIGLLLGLLVGVERERTARGVAGIRTFALITMLGVIAGALGTRYGEWVLASGFLAVLALLVMGNLVLTRQDQG